ncbi:MAG: aminopeptidase [Acidovorax sp.]
MPQPRRALCLALCALPLAGCAPQSTLGYYWQSLSGQVRLLHAARPVPDWIADSATPPALRERLLLAQRARAFAVTALHLPDNASYHRYADLHRAAAVWNVVAAPPYSLTLHTWCFPVVGCVGYRGYFAEADARAEAAELAAQGLEVNVYGVPAYSTLGYLNWLGGDPLLSTFIAWPEGDLVRLVFHELAHQVVYAPGDTMFNESFATAVQRLGGDLWLATEAGPAGRAATLANDQRREEFRALTRATRARLEAIYKQNQPPAQDTQALAAIKSGAFQDFRNQYAALRARWLQAPGSSPAQVAGYDRWVREANNAAFGTLAAYDGWVPAFEALFEQEGRDWPRFYAAVRALAQLPPGERHARLDALGAAPEAQRPSSSGTPAPTRNTATARTS